VNCWEWLGDEKEIVLGRGYKTIGYLSQNPIRKMSRKETEEALNILWWKKISDRISIWLMTRESLVSLLNKWINGKISDGPETGMVHIFYGATSHKIIFIAVGPNCDIPDIFIIVG
jgi:hypothetical protein